MATFYYHPNTTLHLCNKQIACSEDSFKRLLGKEKIQESEIELIRQLMIWKLLTEEMLSNLFPGEFTNLHATLDALTEYGLIIKQFYECRREDETVRTKTFYAASVSIPAVIKYSVSLKHNFEWSKDLRIEEAMKILSFNQFHLALTMNVPKKALQTQTDYMIGGIKADGRYRLKSKRYVLGYSHLIVLSVRDVADHNKNIVEKIIGILNKYMHSETMEKIPWFLLLCENEVQCAHIDRKFKMLHADLPLDIYYILDTDITFKENPLFCLQKIRFQENQDKIISETFSAEKWY